MNLKNNVIIEKEAFAIKSQFHQNTFFLRHLKDYQKIELNEFSIGFIQKGKVHLTETDFECSLKEGMFFSTPAGTKLEISENSNLVVIGNNEMNYLRFIGGPIESEGRLKYIDGCSDSIIVYPPKLGYPCLNHLHFPKGTNQTMHYHPSFRFGLVFDGKGYCECNGELIALLPGDCFFIPENVMHKFKTEEEHLNIIAFHPETDWGPTDQNHPMINKTLFKKDS